MDIFDFFILAWVLIWSGNVLQSDAIFGPYYHLRGWQGVGVWLLYVALVGFMAGAIFMVD